LLPATLGNANFDSHFLAILGNKKSFLGRRRISRLFVVKRKNMKTEIKKLPKSQLEIEFELTEEEFKHFIEHALERFKKHVKVDGFRPGQAPNKLVEDKIKPESLLMEAGDTAVSQTYLKYVKENKLEPIGQPKVSIVKIAQGSPFVFKAVITVLPDVELPDYKEIASKIKIKEVSVTEEEVQDALNYLQKTRAKFILKNPSAPFGAVQGGSSGQAERGDFVEITYQSKDLGNNKEAKDRFILGEGGMIKDFEENLIGMKAGEEKEFSVKFPENSMRKDLAGRDIKFQVKMVSAQKMELPEINDEFAKQMGVFDSSPFAKGERVDTLVALKVSMKQGMEIEKQEEEKQRNRGEILEKIAEKSKFEVPELMVSYEKERLLKDLKNKITETAKISFEEYLATIKQTEEQIKETYQKEAEKRIRNFLVLRELGKKEGIEVTDAEVEEETNKAIKNYSKEDLTKIDIAQLKEYTKGVIQNEKIFKILECQ